MSNICILCKGERCESNLELGPMMRKMKFGEALEEAECFGYRLPTPAELHELYALGHGTAWPRKGIWAASAERDRYTRLPKRFIAAKDSYERCDNEDHTKLGGGVTVSYLNIVDAEAYYDERCCALIVRDAK